MYTLLSPMGNFLLCICGLQLFEYESVYFTCEGVNISAELKVRNSRQVLSKCSNSTVMKRCGIKYAFASDSGEYWCESGAERSNAVSITVSGMLLSELKCKIERSVIMEGDAVTLHCRNTKTSSNFTAEFYKDNFFMGTRYDGKLEIQKVLMSHEGLYKCRIHGVGESPEINFTVCNIFPNCFLLPSSILMTKTQIYLFILIYTLLFIILYCSKQYIANISPTIYCIMPTFFLPPVLSVLLFLTAHFQ
uniref:Ig-like domain-containing protein n=1 Tax=Neolamprologus brichardi TaxID=32507 RepID=A0A3Q4GIY6_NEOBR